MKKEVYQEEFTKHTFTNENCRAIFYEVVVFNECSFQDVNFIDVIFEECTFINCDFTGAHLNETAFKDVTFEGCKLMGLNFEKCNPFQLKMAFNDCNLTLASFYATKIPGTYFTRCKLNEADFSLADLTNAQLEGAELTNTIFRQTNLTNADFSLAHNYTINPSENQLKGAVFSREGVYGLLKHTGIKLI